MKILFTGGAGFIGSHIVDEYIELGHDVVVIDNLSTGFKKNINLKARFAEIDICSEDLTQFLIEEKFEVINHHGAHIHVGRSVEDPEFDAKVNILGSINLMQGAVKSESVKKIIFASTGGAMYGNKKTPFNEQMMPAPLSPYGISKRATELYLRFYKEQYGISYISLRYANVYGPRQNPEGEAGVISIFSEELLSGKTPVINGNGEQTRDYVFVKDVVKANKLALESNEDGEFNIGTGIETDVNMIFNLISQSLNKNVKATYGPVRPGEQQTSSLNYDKACKRLNWSPETDLKEGIKLTSEFFLNKNR